MSQHRLIPAGELAKSEIRLIDIDGRSLLLVNGAITILFSSEISPIFADLKRFDVNFDE